ncbi:MAG TPA: radical SAM protein [Phycisphaerae bacterium]|nr:radical SAM protein [Phycisphaerae bacterium]
MVEVLRKKRKPPILTPSAIPCLRHLPTINITEGCASGCVYCYIQGYAHYPGPHCVVLFDNTAELVEQELRRRRRLPSRVYFSPSSDAFQYLPQVQEVSIATMAVLLRAGIEVSFLTKGFITDRFVRLFASAPLLVFAQLGITTLDAGLWKSLEPRTAPPSKRIEYVRALREAGVATTVRLDPLIPDVTDTDQNLIPLLERLRDVGVRSAAASYLFLRPGFAAKATLDTRSGAVAHCEHASWEYQRFVHGCGGGRMIPNRERALRFARIEALAGCFGIRLTACRCKNPDLPSAPCRIAGPSAETEPALDAQGVFDFAHRTSE